MTLTYGKIIDGIKYICLHNNNEFKKLSLEDNVYFTLRDIVLNAECIELWIDTNSFNEQLINTLFKDKNNNFKYTNVLNEKKYIERLVNWLNYFTVEYFDFKQLEEGEIIDITRYLNFNEWWSEFEKLRILLNEKYNEFK